MFEVLRVLVEESRVGSFREIGVGVDPTIVPTLDRLAETERLITMYVDSYFALNRGVWSLLDLEQELVQLLTASCMFGQIDENRISLSSEEENEDKEDLSPITAVGKSFHRRFSELGLGPLHSQFRVAAFFGIAIGGIPSSSKRLTAIDVLRHYCEYKSRGSNVSVGANSFRQYILGSTKVPNLAHLGIRISNEFFDDSFVSVQHRGAAMPCRGVIDEKQVLSHALNARQHRLYESVKVLSVSSSTRMQGARLERKQNSPATVVPSLLKPPRPTAATFVESCLREWEKSSPFSPSFKKMRDVVQRVVSDRRIRPRSQSRTRKRRRSERAVPSVNNEEDDRDDVLDTLTEYAMLFVGGRKYRSKRFDLEGRCRWPRDGEDVNESKQRRVEDDKSDGENEEDARRADDEASSDDDDDDDEEEEEEEEGEEEEDESGGEQEDEENNATVASISTVSPENGALRANQSIHSSAIDGYQLGWNRRFELADNVEVIRAETLRSCIPKIPRPGRGELRGREIGRWGEALVYQYLLRLANEGGHGGTVEWMNAGGESKISYDIKWTHSSRAHSRTILIEVKSTRFSDRNVFHFTPSEYAYAKQLGDAFHLYRVFNAGRYDAWIAVVRNPFAALERRQIHLCVAI